MLRRRKGPNADAVKYSSSPFYVIVVQPWSSDRGHDTAAQPTRTTHHAVASRLYIYTRSRTLPPQIAGAPWLLCGWIRPVFLILYGMKNRVKYTLRFTACKISYTLISNLLNEVALWMRLNIIASRVINIWNSLSCRIVNSSTLSTFKSRLQNHDLFSWSIELTL